MYIITTGIAAPKPDLGAKAIKNVILKHFLKGLLKGKLLAPKLRKSAGKSLSQPWCSHSNTIYDVQLQKRIVLRIQPRRPATLTQPLQCDLQKLSCKTQSKYAQRRWNCSSKTGSRRQSEKRRLWSTLKRNFQRKIASAKIEKCADKWLPWCTWCSYSNTIHGFPAAKGNSITHAAAAPSNLDAAITLRSATKDSRHA